jgi:transcriptional regulator with XRE-family HTH domain
MKDTQETSFGTYLRSARQRANISQRALAEQIGVDFTYISKIETGALAVPSAETIHKMAIALNADEGTMLNYGGKVPHGLKEALRNAPQLGYLLRLLADVPLSDHVIRQLIDIVESHRQEGG